MSATSQPHVGRVSDGLYKDILVGILMGEYPAASTLPPEIRLARDYGVSRTVVREALKQLKDEGLIRSRQGSGTVVSASAPQHIALLERHTRMREMDDCLTCRMAIEPEIAAIIADRQSTAALDYLQEQMDQLAAATPPGAEPEHARSVNDARFHIRLAQLSQNSHFAAIMSSMRPHILFSINVAKLMPGPEWRAHRDESMREHRDVIDRMLAADADGARRTMRNHIANARARILARIGDQDSLAS